MRREILIIPDKDISEEVIDAVVDAATVFGLAAGIKMPIWITETETFRERFGGTARDASLRWVHTAALNQSNAVEGVRLQVDEAGRLLFETDVERVISPYYVLLSKHDYLRTDTNQSVLNWFNVDYGIAIAVGLFKHATIAPVKDQLRTIALHSFGHMAELVQQGRAQSIRTEIGVHCANWCAMKHPGIPVQNWAELSVALKSNPSPYCSLCTADLRRFFTEA